MSHKHKSHKPPGLSQHAFLFERSGMRTGQFDIKVCIDLVSRVNGSFVLQSIYSVLPEKQQRM